MEAQSVFEEQIIIILKEHEAGIPVAALCRKHRVSDASIYNWKARFGEMEVSEAKRLRALEDENAKLKRMLADAMLDNVALKDLLGTGAAGPDRPQRMGGPTTTGHAHTRLSWQTPSAFASTFNPRRDLALPSPMAPRQIQPLTPPPDLTQPPERTHDWIKLRGRSRAGAEWALMTTPIQSSSQARSP